jgi:hypothetical protein
MKCTFARLSQICGGLLMALALMPAAHAAQSDRSTHLRIANLVQRTDSISLRLCRQTDDACRTLSLTADSLTPVPDLTPGRYRFELRTADHAVTSFTYGIAADRYYGLALFGVHMKSQHHSLWMRLRVALGGIDVREVNGYRILPHMTMMRPGQDTDPAVVRLANMAPGSTTLSGRVRTESGVSSLGSVRYGDIGSPVPLDHTDGTLEISFAGDKFPLLSRKISLAHGSNTVVYVGALRQGHPLVLLDTRTSNP